MVKVVLSDGKVCASGNFSTLGLAHEWIDARREAKHDRPEIQAPASARLGTCVGRLFNPKQVRLPFTRSFVTLYRALAAKSRQRAEYAEQALDFDLADSHTKLACGYAALAYSKQTLGQFESRTIVSPPTE